MRLDRERKDKISEASRAKFQELADEYYTKLTFEYAYELETLGLWHWAIFVVLHLENTAQKSKYIKDLLLKNAHSEEHIGFLINDCKIPTHYINEAKAIYYNSKGLYAKSFHQWLSGEFYQNAHDLLISQMILSSESLSEKFHDLEIVMDKLEQNKDFISNWDSQGKVIYDFLNLRRDTSAYFNQFFDQYGEFKSTIDHHQTQNVNESVRKFIDRLDRLVKAFEKFGKYDVSETSAVVKTELKRILLDWDSKLKIINSKLRGDTDELEFPSKYLMESSDLNLNDKKNALDKFVNVTLAEFLSAN